ncbi:MAG: hypothetical protein FJ138_12375, partial [Deltaproteobacteria bacterium]|nr:hypothetical protein [Deltaproteobacteria bacterium]
MLTLYLPLRGQPRQRPTAAQVEAWLSAVTRSGVARLTSHGTPQEAARDLRDGPEGAVTLAPANGVAQLFDDDAREALLPAELTFEQLRLERAPHPTFLPLGDVELTASCRACGDAVPPARFARYLRALQLIPLAEARLRCPSCDGEVGHKGLAFDREVAFASAWLTLEECGSARLNPALVRAWGALLGGPLALIPEQREATLDWAGGDEVTLG